MFLGYMQISRKMVVIIALFTFTGCVSQQKIALDYQPSTATTVLQGKSASVHVVDERPFVLSGDKEPSYIGKYRAGFGNPWDVKTEGEIPLADLLQKDISAELASKGLAISGDSSAGQSLNIEILDWNFDTYVNGTFDYDLKVLVYGNQNELLVEQKFTEKKVIDGSFWTGAKSAFEREMPKIYAEIIASILKDDGKVMQSLTE